jgi:hypothetical protein
MFNQIEEDAFIYFRFAENIANGNGYVFNVGGEHIESGSSLIWQLFITLLFYIPVNIILAAKLIGIGFGCLALYLVYLISKACIADRHLQIAPPALLAVSIPFYCWSQRGLETPFFLCTVLALAYTCCNKKLCRYWYVFAFIVLCARPEGFFILLSIIPFLIFNRTSLPHFVRDVSVLVILLCCITLFRIYYFHDFFPHTFYIKMDTGFALGFDLLLKYTKYNFLFFLLFPAIPAFFTKRFWTQPMVVIMTFFVLTTFWFVLGDDIFKPYDRKIIPALSFFFIIAASAYDRFYKSHYKLFFKIEMFAFIAIILCFAKTFDFEQRFVKNAPNFFIYTCRYVFASPRGYLSGIYDLFFNPYDCMDLSYYPQTMYQHLRLPIGTNYQATIGKFIKLNYPENISIVYDQMGQTPWYAGLDKSFTDSWGLTDRFLGFYSFGQRFGESLLLRLYNSFAVKFFRFIYPAEKRRITEEEALDYIFNKNPDLILVNQAFPKYFAHTLPAKIERDPRLLERYKLKYVVNDTVNFYESQNLITADPLKIPKGCTVTNTLMD